MAIPSLAMIPSGYKATKLYSVLPTDGVGDFTVTRPTADALNTGNAVRVNSAGLLETMGENVPLLDYSDGGCPVLLTQPQATNLIHFSEDLNGGDWFKSAATADSNVAISPDGTLNATKITATGTNPYLQYQLPSTSQTCSLSVYAKGVGSTIGKACKLVLVQDSYVSQVFEVFTLTGEWQRFEATLTLANVPTTTVSFRFDTPDVGVIGEEVLVFGAQLETLPYATSYIKTEGSTITRVGDVVSDAGDASTFNSNAGVIFVETRVFENDGQGYISLNDGSGSNTLQVRFVNGQVLFRVLNAGAGVGNAISYNMDLTTNHKIACRYDNTEQTFTMFVDGGSVGVKQTGVTTSAVLSDFDFDGGGGTEFYGETKQVQVFNTALTDAELITLTTLAKMAVKRYSFPSEAKAEELLLKLAHEENELAFNKITVTETTHAIVCLGFDDKYEYNPETEESTLVKEGLTYDVDVFWKGNSGYGWGQYEVHPNTPNHAFA